MDFLFIRRDKSVLKIDNRKGVIMNWKHICMVVFHGIIISSAFSVELFVATDGNDVNPGTRARPFATLERARDAVREWKQHKSLPAEGITIWIREGVYRRSRTFELTSEDSGTKNSRVVFRACEGEKVSICGGEEILASVFRPVRDQEVLARLVAEAKVKVLEADIRQLGITD